MFVQRLLQTPCPGLLHISDAGWCVWVPAGQHHRACSTLEEGQRLAQRRRSEEGQPQGGMPSLLSYRKPAFSLCLCREFARLKCCAWRAPNPVQGEIGGPAPRKVLPSQCRSGPDPALPAGARRSPGHQCRARGLKSSRGTLHGSLVGYKTWIILLLLLGGEGFSGISGGKKIHQPDLTHPSVPFPRG